MITTARPPPLASRSSVFFCWLSAADDGAPLKTFQAVYAKYA